MEISLDGKVALVTGASKGIGKAMAASLAASGAKVMLNSRKQDQLEAAAAEMTGEVDIFACNAGFISPISSSINVPPCAVSIRPTVLLDAPVNEPFS